MYFADRLDAGRRLAGALAGYRGRHPLVLAIPRGAVPMGEVIAEALGGDLDVVLVRKLGAPWNEEFAVGAVDETGWVWLAEHAISAGATPEYLTREQARQMAVLRQRRERWTPGSTGFSPEGRVAIVVDDGLATGATMVAALHAVRARKPQRLVCAVPVASPEALERVRGRADEVVCLAAPRDFHAVGEFYADFRQVDDEEVATVLARRPASAG